MGWIYIVVFLASMFGVGVLSYALVRLYEWWEQRQ